MNILVNILFFSFLAGAATLAGVYAVYFFGGWAKKNSVFFISFAVGILLANAFFHLLPEAAQTVGNWPYWTLGTIIFLFILEHSFIIHSCREEHCEVHVMGRMSLIGLGFHSLVDGVVIGIAFGVSYFVGLLASLAVIFHKIAEGVCIYSLLIHDDMPAKKSLFYSWLVAIITPLGAVLAYCFLRGTGEALQGSLLAAAAGVFIYIGASDLLPETHKKMSWWNVGLVLAGAAFVLALGLIE